MAGGQRFDQRLQSAFACARHVEPGGARGGGRGFAHRHDRDRGQFGKLGRAMPEHVGAACKDRVEGAMRRLPRHWRDLEQGEAARIKATLLRGRQCGGVARLRAQDDERKGDYPAP